MKKIAFWPLYPFLMAAAIPLDLLSLNLAVFTVGETLRALAALLAAAAAVFLVVALATRRPHLAGLVAGLALLLVWVPGLRNLTTLALVALPFGLAVLVYAQGRRAGASLVLNVFLLVLLAPPAYAVIADALWQARHTEAHVAASDFERLDPAAAAGRPLPSILHVVLDAYGANAVLREFTGFDNGPFTAALQELGFVVPAEVHTPYNQTSHAMAAIFAGGYLAAGQAPLDIADDDRLRLGLADVVRAGPLRRFFEGLGYRYAFTFADVGAFRYRKGDLVSAPEQADWGLSPFERFLISRTSLKWLGSGVFGFRWQSLVNARTHLAVLRNAFAPGFFNGLEKPAFVYQHVLAPHPPFTVDRDGQPTTRWAPALASGEDGDGITLGRPELQRAYMEGYVEKARYANRVLLAEIRAVIAATKGPLIIVVHGDHGSGSRYFQDSREKSCVRERFHPFLAVYTSDPGLRRRLGEWGEGPVNLVNLYRVLLDGAFGFDLGRLPDRSFFVPWSQPRRFEPLDAADLNRACGTLG